MLKKIYQELVIIRKELQAIRSSLEHELDHPTNMEKYTFPGYSISKETEQSTAAGCTKNNAMPDGFYKRYYSGSTFG